MSSMPKNLVLFLEEKSAKEFLDRFLPKVLSDEIFFKCIAFEGKSDLEKQLDRKIRGWKTPNTCQKNKDNKNSETPIC